MDRRQFLGTALALPLAGSTAAAVTPTPLVEFDNPPAFSPWPFFPERECFKAWFKGQVTERVAGYPDLGFSPAGIERLADEVYRVYRKGCCKKIIDRPGITEDEAERIVRVNMHSTLNQLVPGFLAAMREEMKTKPDAGDHYRDWHRTLLWVPL